MRAPSQDQANAARQALQERDLGFDVSAFFRAIRNGDAEVTQLFLRAGMPVSAPDPETSRQPLETAVEAGRADVVSVLSAAGAPVEHRDAAGRTMLMLAAAWGWPDVIAALLAAGADADARGPLGRTALMGAAQENQPAVLEALLLGGASRDAQDEAGMTALMLASAEGRFRAVETLLAAGSDLDVTNHDGMTASDLARKGRHADVFRFLGEAAERDAGAHAYAGADARRDITPDAPVGVAKALAAALLMAVFVVLTVLNLGGWLRGHAPLDASLALTGEQAATRAMWFCVDGIEAFRTEHGRLPTSLTEAALDDVEGATYMVSPTAGTYVVQATVDGKSVTFDSGKEAAAPVAATGGRS